MPRTRLRQVFLLLLSLLVVLPRVGGPHLHLCLDGLEPPVTLHLADDAAHPAGDQVHDDRTVDMGSPVLGKASPPGLDGALLALAVLLLFAASPVVPRPVRSAIRFELPPPFLRPPLRGPPA